MAAAWGGGKRPGSVADTVNTVADSVQAVAEEVRDVFSSPPPPPRRGLTRTELRKSLGPDDRRDAALTRPVLALFVAPFPNHTACRAA